MRDLNINGLDFSKVVLKQRSTECDGIHRVYHSNYTIGMVLSGDRYIHQDDKVIRVRSGELFFMGLGLHFVEDVPTRSKPYEHIAFNYTSLQMQQAVILFNGDLSEIEIDVSDNENFYDNVSISKPSNIVKNIFMGVDTHYRSLGFVDDSVSGCLKLAELANVIIRHERGAILRHMMMSLDSVRANFESVIYSNIFKNRSIEQLSRESSRSLTTFKKEFDRYFGMPPHQWFQQQRLNYARFLLTMTDNTIACIGELCMIPNPSHFIKIFKRSYGVTPASYRAQSHLSILRGMDND